MPRLRLRIRPDGSATLAGIPNYQDFRSILNSAFLDLAEGQRKAWLALKQKRTRDNIEALAWHEHMLKVLKLYEAALQQAYKDSFPKSDRPRTKAERWEIAREKKKTRELIDSFIEKHVPEVKP